MVSSIGGAISLVGALMFLYILWKTITSGEKAPANPWGEGATTLEWTVDSPAPFHTHEQIPEVPEEEHGEKIYVSPEVYSNVNIVTSHNS